MHVISIGNDTKVFGEFSDLTIYSSNLFELKHSKIKYQVTKKTK